MVEDQEAAISDPGEACEEVPLRAGHEHPGREGLQLDGVLAQQEEAELVRGECPHAALPKGHPGTVNCLFDHK